MKSDKTKNILRFAAFVVIFAVLSGLLETAFFDRRGLPSTWLYVSAEEHEPIDLLVVGNSHARNSIDTEMLSRELGINARTLGFSSSNGGLTATDLEVFLRYSVPEVVMLEMCPFMTDNYEDMRDYNQGIIYTHFDGIPDLHNRLWALSRSMNPEDVPGGLFQLLRPTYIWRRIKAFCQNTGIIAETPNTSPYGYEALDGIWQDYKEDFPTVERRYDEHQPDYSQTTLCEENRHAAERIIELSQEYGFELWFYGAPVAEFMEIYAEQMAELRDLAEESGHVAYFDDYLAEYVLLGLGEGDFYDHGHLNRHGAEKFTGYIIPIIAERLGITDLQAE